MIIKEMEYKPEYINETLATGTYKDHKYIVKNYGINPCAYVSLDPNCAIDTDFINCHGGITYCANCLPREEPVDDVWWIGWDYSHLGDFVDINATDDAPGKRWTSEEMEQECLKVIVQLEELLDRYNSNS